MRARAVALAALASVSIVGIGWQLGSPAIDASQSRAFSTSGTDAATAATDAAAQAAATANAAAAATTAPVGQSGTFTGSVVATRFGNIQVSVTIDAGTITDVTALQLTDHDGRSVQISNRAAPILRSEVLAAQSASVQNVSGATYTTDGYLQSLQSALDAAGF
ncbi:FMN-binding protein [Cryobacterium glaciale]|uniref:FMN-binding protein n=1 Tax=Cryobacterium glaciale TaxID=1259145 RepID=A0A4R8UY33_9MICO|nr:FMN-binding protein [Cryobacterium glaciale]TFB73765.1 FMN-binding protein [Cryobacterium glaciale]